MAQRINVNIFEREKQISLIFIVSIQRYHFSHQGKITNQRNKT
ncbi:hypothetical protein Q7O_000266 [Pectobacterium carotovorum subsp. carotovorum PCCS1]|nr:hypothetical protein [Pectobacterium carotovorum subsp. carotovorum PCCS1]